jgi:uncharacterized phage-associated protein
VSASVNDLARELIDQLRLDPVTAAGGDKVHKLLYYVQGHHAAVTGRPLFSEPIEAADSGPVVEGFAGADLDAPRGELDNDVLDSVGYVVSRYGRLSVLDLQHLTRAEPPWQTGRRSPDRRVQLADMIAYFRGDGAPFHTVENTPIDRPALDGPALDGPALDGPALDGPAFDRAVFDGAVEHGQVAERAAGAGEGVEQREEFKAAAHGALPLGYPMMPPQPADKRKWQWIVGGIVVATILGYVGLFTFVGLGARNAVVTLDDKPEGKDAAAGQMGKPARDGKFEFTVTDMECGKHTIGDGIFSSAARGTYCVITVNVKNVDGQAQPFDESSQKAYDEKGARYSHDADAEYHVNSGRHAWFKRIKPGQQVTGKLVFDIPQGTRLAAIELHDSPVSGGVKVPLTSR